MTKRLHVVLTDAEYRAIQQAARSRRMSIPEWLRQALGFALRRAPQSEVRKKLGIIRAAMEFDFPAIDIDHV